MGFEEKIASRIVPKKGRIQELTMRLRHEEEAFDASANPDGRIDVSYSRLKRSSGTRKTLVEVEIDKKALAFKHVPFAYPVEMGPYYVAMMHRYVGDTGVVFKRVGDSNAYEIALKVSKMPDNTPELFTEKQEAIRGVLRSVARDIVDPRKYAMIVASEEPLRGSKALIPPKAML